MKVIDVKQVMIAPGGPLLKNILDSFKIYSPIKIYIVTPKAYLTESNDFKQTLEDMKITTKVIEIGTDLWREFLDIVGGLVCVHTDKDSYDDDKSEDSNDFIMHTDTGDCELRTISTVTAFVNGIKALSYYNKVTRLLPLFNLRYQTVLTDKKMQILQILEEDITCCKSFEDLSKKTGMSLPLISYHINGNLKSEGLKKLGLIEVEERNGRMNVRLSTQGYLLLKGRILPMEEENNTIKTQDTC